MDMKQTRFARVPARFLVYLLLLTMLTAGVSFSRYKTTLTATGSVQVARPVVVLDYVPNTVFSDLKPGDSVMVPFSVKNTDSNGNQNQVSLEYWIVPSITTVSGQPLQYTYSLYAEDGTSPLELNSAFTLGFSAPETDKYQLKISWSESMNDQAYSNQTQKLTITINAQQTN